MGRPKKNYTLVEKIEKKIKITNEDLFDGKNRAYINKKSTERLYQGRKTTEKKIVFITRFFPEIHKSIQYVSEATGQSMCQIIRKAVQRDLAEMVKVINIDDKKRVIIQKAVSKYKNY